MPLGRLFRSFGGRNRASARRRGLFAPRSYTERSASGFVLGTHRTSEVSRIPARRPGLSSCGWRDADDLVALGMTLERPTRAHPEIRANVRSSQAREFGPATEKDRAKRGNGFRWWQVRDSNPRRQCRLIYSQLPLAARATCHRIGAGDLQHAAAVGHERPASVPAGGAATESRRTVPTSPRRAPQTVARMTPEERWLTALGGREDGSARTRRPTEAAKRIHMGSGNTSEGSTSWQTPRSTSSARSTGRRRTTP